MAKVIGSSKLCFLSVRFEVRLGFDSFDHLPKLQSDQSTLAPRQTMPYTQPEFCVRPTTEPGSGWYIFHGVLRRAVFTEEQTHTGASSLHPSWKSD